MEHRKQTTEIAKANEQFDLFCNATTLKSILGHYRHLCDLLRIRPNVINQFYPKLKAKLRSWKAQALWKKFDQRANYKCYNRGKACPNTRVLIIGGGPCGLRSAIEAQLLGAKVVVVEKRDRMSRNNVLHLWPFVIHDLRALGAKKFFGKFCAGSIDHISIRQLQCILLKVALILGVEFHESVSFDALISPPESQEEGKIGWRAKTTPADHPVSQYEFDVLIGADGKRNTLEGFKRKEFRGKLAIAITANFINKRTEAEARVEEISGVAFIFNQKFFKELYQETGIDLENIVYYKDDTHYFVMTAKKHSLIDKGVILQDHADTAKLLAKENVDREALMLYAREAAEFSTEYQMIGMEFAVNHYGQPDVAMFDFTSMYAAENASRILERRGHKLLMILVGDSLLEPFWPTGSGCARGFLSSLDACWAIKGWGANVSPLEVIAERESIYRLLGQTTPENLNRDYAAYTLDPHTRYPNLNVSSVTPIQVRSLLDTDDPDSVKQPPVQSDIDIPKKRRRRDLRGDSQVHPDTLLRWLQKQVALYDSVQIRDMGASFKNGLAICAIIHRYRPNLIDFHNLNPDDAITNNQLAFDILEKELGIPPIMTGEEMAQCDVPDKLAMFSYLTQIYEVFRGEIPYIKHPKLEPENEERPAHSKQLTPDQKVQLIDRIVRQDSATRTRHSRSRHNENLNPADKKGDTISRRSRKRRSTEKMGATVEERQKRLAEIEKNRAERMRRRQYLRNMATQQFYKSMQMLQANAKREKDEPFEDYSIFLYRQTAPDFKDRVKYLEQKILYPDREPKIHAGHHRNSIDEEFSGRIKSIEDKLKGSTPVEKKPRDLLRAIGKIEKTDWNVKEIEKKIEENKMGRLVRHDKVERVPKWSREQMCICFIQFLARQIKMEKKGRDQRETDSKYADIDNTLKNIDRKIKEGNVLGYNKVSAMAEQFSNKSQDAEPKMQKSNVKPTITLPAQGGSEMCHFCNKRVYLMERLSAEGKFFHRGCFRCEYCSTSLRIGNHTFDRDKNGGRFYCTQHFGFSGTLKTRNVEKKKIMTLNKENIPATSVNLKTPEKGKISLEGVVGLDLLDRGQTPERIEFENLAGISDAEEPQSQMDEDEWTDRNFGASTAEMGSSDDISDMSDSDDDNEVYEEAIDQPLTTEGTLELAKNWTLRYSHPHAAMGQSDTGSNEYEDSSDEYTNEDDESTTATEDEDDIRARELRKQEVWLKNPTCSSDTDSGSETEVASDEGTSEESEENSATEISTDSEFEHDGATPTQHEIPEITINDAYVRKTRGNYVEPKKVQVKSKVISSINGNLKQDKDLDAKSQLKMDHEINPSHLEKESKLNLLGFNNANAVPLINPRKGDYLLNRTHSTEGIASKLSLELKKKYLLGGTAFGGSVMKSGSASNVDTQLRNFTDAISQHQKLLNPAPEPSPTMQAFLQGTSKLRSNNTQLSPISPTAIFSSVKPYTANRSSQNLLNNDNPIYKSTILPEISKTQLPDLVKESSILKSKTTPNIVCGESKNTESKEIVKEQVAPSQLHAAKNCEILGNARSCENTENNFAGNMDENNGFRPRSPLHETSIIVPQVDWSKNTEERKETASTGDSEIDSDSLSSGDGEAEEEAQDQPPPVMNLSPPRLQIHSTDGDLLLDEEAEKCKDFDDGQSFEPDSIECSFLQDKMLNNNKIFSSAVPATPCVNKTSMELEIVKNEIEQLELQDEGKKSISNCSTPTSITSAISNKHDDSEENDVTTAALTETEFSEWARDGEVLVSDDLRDVEFNINPEFITTRRKLALSDASKTQGPITIAKEEDLTDMDLDSSKLDKQLDVPVNNTSKLLANGENIDFMDTDNESLLDDSLQDASNMVMLKNRGYVEFVNIKSASSLASSQDKLIADAPIAKLEVENDSEEEAYYDKNVIEINPITMDDVMNKLNGSVNKAENDGKSEGDMEIKSNSIQQDQSIAEAVNKELFQSMEEDSLLIVEPAEDTTTSEVVTILASPVNPQVSIIASQTEKQSGQQEEEETKTAADLNNPDYLEYVKRLQSRIAEFSNAKDSIDVRKSKRKNSKSSLQSRTAEMIAEEIKNQETTINNSFNSPATSRKLEEITRERFKQKNVIQDLLMDKVEAHKQKSAEKKARRAARASSFNSTSALSPIRPSIPSSSLVNKFVPTSIVTPENSPSHSTNSVESKQPVEIKKSHETRQLPWKSETEKVTNEESNKNDIQSSENITLIKIANETENNFRTPIAPPRLKHEEAKRTAEKARQDARERARLKSDEDLGLSPEDKIKELRMKVARRQLSMEERKTKEETQPEDPRIRLYTYGANKTELKLQTSKSTDNMKAVAEAINFSGLSAANAKSMDELLHADSPKSNSSIIKRDKKQKTKDPERRKSIIQAVSDFFFKKESSPSPSNQKDKLSMFRLTSKTKGKLCKSYSEGSDLDKVLSPKMNARPKSVCEGMLTRNFLNENPPPIPPPPLIYTIPTTQISDDSLSDDDTKTTAVSTSCIHKATITEGSCNSISRKTKTTKRIARQAQLKRLRMAQEIQRKLEETEVKQRELESRGVSVEKALRGEGECSDREEADLLREWFDLMKERTELRRYEKELLVRAQEVQLEDRHERLQQELRERLADDDNKKTSADVKKEGEILTEMLEIVAKRDSLIALLEEERQRWCRSTCQTLTPFSTHTVCFSHLPSFFTPHLNNTSSVLTLIVILITYVFLTNLIQLFINFCNESLTFF
ncbi:F-actin-monooxygenase Mical isoform X1 [Apis cerana]|uniref:F-actin-monooxygenase Mical isoform X1 n=1 Tax=Apis cerana TaxID=7461 RepID=UPI002B2297FE|nr:F-actin-monooxygenase Mical isoform X1 [Apis cerana]XP_061937099.1 F-actin-monooxygenase Mical isoform X1 [Apis cerana]XP_061937100.1 F-actin-monooxygenase Mical isoform X1 [Apis cerana]